MKTNGTVKDDVTEDDVMKDVKAELRKKLEEMCRENERQAEALTDCVSILEYEKYTKEAACGSIWTEAFNIALSEHEVVEVPYREEPYYIDASIIMHTNNSIRAHAEARIKKAPGMKLLMLRNEHIIDESHFPAPKDAQRDCNLSVFGGIWDGGAAEPIRAGFVDEVDSFYGGGQRPCSFPMLHT